MLNRAPRRRRPSCSTSPPTRSTRGSTRRSPTESSSGAGSSSRSASPRPRPTRPKLLAAGRAEFAILDIHDLAIARERGLDVVGVAAIVQRPLAAVIAADRGRTRAPADLAGGTVGVTGLPSDEAVLASVLEAGGVDPGEVETLTIGFDSVAAIAAGRLEAATAFWNAEGVALRRLGVPTREFRVDAFGAPRYPELIVAASARTVAEQPDLVAGMVGATGDGYRRGARRSPASSRAAARGRARPRSRRAGRSASGAARRRRDHRDRSPASAGAARVGCVGCRVTESSIAHLESRARSHSISPARASGGRGTRGGPTPGDPTSALPRPAPRGRRGRSAALRSPARRAAAGCP